MNYDRLSDLLRHKFGLVENSFEDIESPFKEIYMGEDVCVYAYDKDFNVERINFWQYLRASGHSVPKLFGSIDGKFYAEMDDKIIVSTETLPSSQKLSYEDYHKLGRIMADLHHAGYQYRHTTTNLENWYSQGFTEYISYLQNPNFNLAFAVADAILLRAAILSRFYKYLPLGSVASTIYLCRDFRHDNLIKTDDGIMVTDFDFAGMNLPATEIIRFAVEILMKRPNQGPELVGEFASGYRAARFSSFAHPFSVSVYLKYLLFNTFPLYLDISPEEKLALLNERNMFLTTLVRNYNFLLQEFGGGRYIENLQQNLEELEFKKWDL